MTENTKRTLQTILVVDDEADNVELIVDSLEFRGLEVKSAEHGEQAIELLKDYKPDLILLDLSMPVMDGWKTHKHLNTDSKTKSIPVIALTAHAMTGDKERVLKAGFDGYISKPINIATLLDDIYMALEEGKAKP